MSSSDGGSLLEPSIDAEESSSSKDTEEPSSSSVNVPRLCLFGLIGALPFSICFYVIVNSVPSARDGPKVMVSLGRGLPLSFDRWEETKSILSPKIQVVTANTLVPTDYYPMPGAVGRQFFNIGNGKTWDKSNPWYTRLQWYVEYLEGEETKDPEKLVILADGGDVLFGGCSEDELLARYDALVAAGSPKIIYGAQFREFPELKIGDGYWTHPHTDRRHSVQSKFNLTDDAWAPFQNEVACKGQTSGKCSEPPLYTFLNAGFGIGPVGIWSKLLRKVLQIKKHDINIHEKIWNDQGALATYMLENFDEVGLDYSGTVNVNLVNSNTNLLIVQSDSVWNTLANSVQCFVHGNGESFNRWEVIETALHSSERSVSSLHGM